ncbi:hypothetical protein BH09MYX1_BH09MYX1_50530 [soil metagenome]
MELTERGIDDGKGEIARDEVLDASVIPHATDAGFSVVRVRMRRGEDRRVVIDDLARARRVIAHLGCAIADQPWTFVGESPVRIGYVLAALALFSPVVWIVRFFLEASPLFTGLTALVLAAIVYLVLRNPVKGRVALDGVTVSWLRFARVVPLEAIADVTCERKGATWHEVRIDLRDEDDVHVHFSESEDAEILAERVREALDAARMRTSPIVAPLLRPPRFTAREWIGRLRSVGSGAVTHREAPVDADVLWDIVESGVARPTDRAAAAVALAITGHDAQKRLRLMSSSVSEPRLRVALAAAANADESALESAMDEVETPSARAGTLRRH